MCSTSYLDLFSLPMLDRCRHFGSSSFMRFYNIFFASDSVGVFTHWDPNRSVLTPFSCLLEHWIPVYRDEGSTIFPTVGGNGWTVSRRDSQRLWQLSRSYLQIDLIPDCMDDTTNPALLGYHDHDQHRENRGFYHKSQFICYSLGESDLGIPIVACSLVNSRFSGILGTLYTCTFLMICCARSSSYNS